MLLDGDGIVINKPMRFSQNFSKDYNIPLDLILPFFDNEFQLCLIGKADLKEVVKPYLMKWNWNGSVEEFLDYWFRSENYVDNRIIDKISEYRLLGIRCYIHSNQEKYRTEYMKGVMGLDKIVDGIFSAAYLGTKKPNQNFWQEIFSRIQPAKKDEVLVWDDSQENVVSASDFGFNSELYTNYDAFLKTMDKYLN